MRKILLFLCLCLLFLTKANAQLTIDNCYFEIEPVSFDINSADNNDEAGIPCQVKLINPTGSKILGYTFDFFTPKGMKLCYIDFNNLQRYPSTRNDKHHVFQWQFMETMEDGTSRYRVLCYPKPMDIEKCALSNDDYAIATVYYTAETSGIYHPYMKVDKSNGQINSDLNVTYLNDANEISDFQTKTTSSLAVVTDATATEGSQEYVHTMGAEWGTICLPMDVTGVSDADLRFYTATYDESKGELAFCSASHSDIILPANTPAVIYCGNPEGGTFTFTGTFVEPSDTYPTQGALVGTYKQMLVEKNTFGQTNYMLQRHGSEMGFYKVDPVNCWLTDCRCFVSVATSGEVKSTLSINTDEADAIQMVSSTNAASQLIYNLQGCSVATPQSKHIYISNGKKIIWK